MSIVEITMDGVVPKSLNRIGSRGGWRAFHAHKTMLQGRIATELMVSKFPRCKTVRVTAVLRFPLRRRRDAENFEAVLTKACGDALTSRHVIPDDTPAYYDFDGVSFDPDLGPSRTLLTFDIELETT